MKKIIITTLAILITTLSFAQIIDDSHAVSKCFHNHILDKTNHNNPKQIALESKYDVKFYWLDINLERTSTTISGNVTINAVVQNAPLDTFEVELVPQLLVDSAKINGTLITAVPDSNFVYFLLSTPLAIGANFSAQIYYHGNPPSGGFFSGISHANSPSWGNEVVWTLSEPFHANDWWPCKQDLTDKADSSWVFVTTSDSNKVGSNGLLTNVVSLPNNKARYEWKSKYPIDYYLISVSIAKYVDHTIYAHPAGTTDSIMIQNYVYDNPQTLPHFQGIIDSTAQMIELYSKLYGMYPFKNEKYGHCMAPLSGGMEHQTMTTLGYFDFSLISHELGHMWWGDHVTCSSWSDIWMNEGFASYSEYLCREYLHSPADALDYLKTEHTNVMSSPGGSVYVTPANTNDENIIFDSRLSYDKGSSILHQIRFELQDDSLFFNVLKGFQVQYSYGVASGNNFKDYLNAHSSIDFTDFFNEWYIGEGYPTYHIVWNKWNDTLYFSSTQTTSSTVTPLFKMLMQYKLLSPGGDTLILEHQTANVNYFKVPTHKTITGIVVDPNDWVIDGTATVAMGIEDQTSPVCFSVFPVPCNDLLNVYFSNSPGKDVHVIVTDITGRQVLQTLAETNEISINVEGLQAGVYLVMATDGTHSITKKFVKV